jgi:thiamine biosynthesis protein ThiS
MSHFGVNPNVGIFKFAGGVMKIILNGSAVNTESSDLASLVKSRGLESSSLVIEHNKNVVKQENWAATPVREGDTIELLNFVGGG